MAARQSNGFFVVQLRHQEKNICRTQQGERHPLCAGLICLQRELWLCGLNQSDSDKGRMKKKSLVSQQRQKDRATQSQQTSFLTDRQSDTEHGAGRLLHLRRPNLKF